MFSFISNILRKYQVKFLLKKLKKPRLSEFKILNSYVRKYIKYPQKYKLDIIYSSIAINLDEYNQIEKELYGDLYSPYNMKIGDNYTLIVYKVISNSNTYIFSTIIDPINYSRLEGLWRLQNNIPSFCTKNIPIYEGNKIFSFWEQMAYWTQEERDIFLKRLNIDSYP